MLISRAAMVTALALTPACTNEAAIGLSKA